VKIWIAFCLGLPSLLVAQKPLVLQISNETAPPGGWVQIKISLSKPQAVATGAIAMNFDPTVFGPPANCTVFSANGDAWGTTDCKSTMFAGGPDSEISFEDVSNYYDLTTSPATGIGRLRDLPLFVVNVPVLPTATPGQTVTITADTNAVRSSTLWLDPNGNPYDVSVIPGTVTVGGSLSVQSITPGGGNLPAGTVVRLNGTGFTPSTVVLADAVSVGAPSFISPQEIDLTLNAPADLTGKRFVVQNPDGAAVEYYSFLAPSPSGYDIFPLIASSRIPFESFHLHPAGGGLHLQNPNPLAADLAVETVYGPSFVIDSTASIPGDSTMVYPMPDGLYSGTITSSQPLRSVLEHDLSGIARWPVYPPGAPPLIGSVVNAASQMQGAVAPGELITISGIALDSFPFPSFLDGLERSVLFDGQPAPIASAATIHSYSTSPGSYSGPIGTTAVTVMVPYQLANQPWTTIELVSGGVRSAGWGMPVVLAAPAIFTTDSSGVGQALVLNPDNNFNSPAHPAFRGNVIHVLATGCGQAGSSVQAAIGGVDAAVRLSNDAASLAAGVCVLNMSVPVSAPPGPAVPISLSLGDAHSPDGVTIAVN
jgi:uncharacterized protein (TIGR03437 family)